MTHDPAADASDNFRLWCALFGLFFLLVTQFGKLIYFEDQGELQLPDFSQFYMGGLVALHGDWDSLYPIPKPNSDTNPGAFDTSTERPRYRELRRSSGVSGITRFIQPPPVALLYIPVALLPADLSGFFWIFLQCIATWAISLQAAKMFDLCAAGPSRPIPQNGLTRRAPGLLILLVCLSPIAHGWIRVANISPIIGWSIGVVTLSLIRQRDAAGAFTIVLAGMTKYAPLVVAPLYLAMRRWRAIIECVVISAVLLGISLAIMGVAPFHVFIHDMVPTFGRSVVARWNMSIIGMLVRIANTGILPPTQVLVIRIATWIFLALILALIFTRPRRDWDNPINVMTAAATLVSWFLVFSPITWLSYFAYIAPFWGWLAYQATQSRGRLIAAAVAIALCYFPLQLIAHFNAPEPFFSYPCFSLILTMLTCIWIMYCDRIAPDLSP